MNNFYGTTNMQIKVFEVEHDDVDDLNKFLTAFSSKIIDVQTHAMSYGYTKFIIVYQLNVPSFSEKEIDLILNALIGSAVPTGSKLQDKVYDVLKMHRK